MTHWKYRANVRQYINHKDHPAANDTDPLPKFIRDGVVSVLEALPKLARETEWGGDTINDRIGYLKNQRDIVDIKDFNNWLYDLYNHADAEMIWLGS